MRDLADLAGRVLIAMLFLGGFVQKVSDPGPVAGMIRSIGLPGWFVWPVAAFNLMAAVCLVCGPRVRVWALILAVYCIFTSWFHWQLRSDPWQVTIAVKNWAIAGGLLVLWAHGPGRFVRWR
ncbi:LysR family transcriptional regulator [Primorskyibacter flagellatus]|uniref:LysR family transcriptional regulator n=1 Tax=Primorskyibacter flagellatus TaxID=1387277 RepID=A0A917ABF4_9RHOB|nr:DoxX family protein [Primorskyibacter flagellatus]GGE40158.1 LysR family transcriptional regulator [Primorskyibacter flagellatus]